MAVTETSAETLAASPEAPADKPHAGFRGMTVGSIGVVFGDIGASPLYAF